LKKDEFEMLPMELSKPATHLSTRRVNNVFIKFTKSGFVTNMGVKNSTANDGYSYHEPLFLKVKD